MAFLAGSSIFGNGWKQTIYYKLMGVKTFDSFDMTKDKMDQCLKELSMNSIKYMYGYANAIYHLALHHQESNVKVKLKSCITTAENLTDTMRKVIETSFGCSVFNQYGCNDAGLSAYECEYHNGLHLINTRAFIEVLEDGTLISSDTKNDVMPMLRYDSGDRIKLSSKKCKCGRGFPLIEEIYGRSNDVVINPKSGAIVHSEFFNHLFREDERIKMFQIAINGDKMNINIHSNEIFDTTKYIEKLNEKTGFEVLFNFNKEFTFSSNGKLKMVVINNVK